MEHTIKKAEEMKLIACEKVLEEVGDSILLAANQGLFKVVVRKDKFEYNLQVLLDILQAQGYSVKEVSNQNSQTEFLHIHW